MTVAAILILALATVSFVGGISFAAGLIAYERMLVRKLTGTGLTEDPA